MGKKKYRNNTIVKNNIVLLEYVEKTPSKVWKCKFICPYCGNEFIARLPNVVSGGTQSCGCLHRKRTSDATIDRLEGKKFGKWTVLSLTDKRIKDGCVVWKCQCDCGNIGFVPSRDLKNGHSQSCGCIGQSAGEYKVEITLQQMEICYTKQYIFENCKDVRLLRFDFYLPDYNCCIEYDGKQHFQLESTGIFSDKQNFIKIQKRDNIKNQYCKDNNIKLIRIPYWEYDEINKEYIANEIYQ